MTVCIEKKGRTEEQERTFNVCSQGRTMMPPVTEEMRAGWNHNRGPTEPAAMARKHDRVKDIDEVHTTGSPPQATTTTVIFKTWQVCNQNKLFSVRDLTPVPVRWWWRWKVWRLELWRSPIPRLGWWRWRWRRRVHQLKLWRPPIPRRVTVVRSKDTAAKIVATTVGALSCHS